MQGFQDSDTQPIHTIHLLTYIKFESRRHKLISPWLFYAKLHSLTHANCVTQNFWLYARTIKIQFNQR